MYMLVSVCVCVYVCVCVCVCTICACMLQHVCVCLCRGGSRIFCVVLLPACRRSGLGLPNQLTPVCCTCLRNVVALVWCPFPCFTSDFMFQVSVSFSERLILLFGTWRQNIYKLKIKPNAKASVLPW